MENILQIKDLRVVLNGNLVLDEISLKMEETAFLALIGPNGGGKTTLLKVILGLIQPHSGEIKVFGLKPSQVNKKIAGIIGYVSQTPLFDPAFPVSALDVVLMGNYRKIGLGRRASKTDRQRAIESLRLVGMDSLANRPIGQMSGGQQQRVFIARSLITQPRLLLLDEPTTGVDALSQDQFYRLLKELQLKLSLSVILVSHDIGLVPKYCDQVACLNRRLFLHGKPTEVLHSEALREAYGCEVDFLFHGKIPHRVVDKHNE